MRLGGRPCRQCQPHCTGECHTFALGVGRALTKPAKILSQWLMVTPIVRRFGLAVPLTASTNGFGSAFASDSPQAGFGSHGRRLTGVPSHLRIAAKRAWLPRCPVKTRPKARRRPTSAETTQRDLGRNIERLVCSLQKPILVVTDTFAEPKRVMIAFDGGTVTRKGVRMVAASPLFKGLPVHLLMSGSKRQDTDEQIDWDRQTLEAGGFEVSAAVVPGDAELVIAGAVAEREIDVLIMGAYSHSPLRRLLMGSKTTELLRATRIPTLLLR